MAPSPSQPRGASPDSLFDELDEDDCGVASRSSPPIPGLWVFPSLLHPGDAKHILDSLAEEDVFNGGSRNQIMLFSSPPPSAASMPGCAISLLETLESLLEPFLPSNTLELVFHQPLARQVILNLYLPGEGISPHVDLPGRYADGILGVSLTGGCVMSFTRGIGGESKDKDGREERHDVYLPPRTVYVLSGEARWEWAHGIEGRMEDVVDTHGGRETLLRDTRVSVTFRWMKEGAEVLS